MVYKFISKFVFGNVMLRLVVMVGISFIIMNFVVLIVNVFNVNVNNVIGILIIFKK